MGVWVFGLGMAMCGWVGRTGKENGSQIGGCGREDAPRDNRLPTLAILYGTYPAKNTEHITLFSVSGARDMTTKSQS